MAPPTKKSEASAIGRRFGENVIWLRKQAGLSQQAIAERAGLHRVEVSLIERGLRVPRLETILKLAGAVEVDPCELIREMHWENATDSRPGRFVIGRSDPFL
jgi:transcriptional regulator with XRE-family HTH domain